MAFQDTSQQIMPCLTLGQASKTLIYHHALPWAFQGTSQQIITLAVVTVQKTSIKETVMAFDVWNRSAPKQRGMNWLGARRLAQHSSTPACAQVCVCVWYEWEIWESMDCTK